jgi:hypothetical protein
MKEGRAKGRPVEAIRPEGQRLATRATLGTPAAPDAASGGKTPEPASFKRRNVPNSFAKLYDLTLKGVASPRKAIKMLCAECCGYDRQAIAECPARGCPLWRYRPWEIQAQGHRGTGSKIAGAGDAC